MPIDRKDPSQSVPQPTPPPYPNNKIPQTPQSTPRPNPVQQAMSSNKFANPTWTFPSDLGSINAGEEPYIIFNIISSVAKGSQLLGSIALNMPTTVVSQYSTQYDELEMGVDKARDLLNAIRNDTSNTLSTEGWRMAARVLSVFGMENAVAKQEQLSGKIVNPHMANIFKGVNFRPFSFSFDLVPKNSHESKMIHQIITAFKYHMHPDIEEQYGHSRYMLYPENFVIGLFSPSQEYLFKISTCVLKDMNVDYGGTGVPAFFTQTGAPVAVKLTLDFVELEILTKKRIDQGY
jgi:hypothetical protein